jgi:hypothetical protein
MVVDEIMKTQFCLKSSLLTSLVLCSAIRVAFAQAPTPIFKDDFESGTPATTIPNNGTPWRVNDSGRPATYQSASNPFSSGNVYAYLNDDITTSAVRLMAADAADTGLLGPNIASKITTLSFSFVEPTHSVTNTVGLGFGYSNAIDLNGAGRNFRTLLLNGQMSPDSLVAGTGGPVSYQLNKVNTVFMLANDSASAVTDYRLGHSLDPARADVWISLDGADPIFAFTLNKQNPTSTMKNFGFRSFTTDIVEFKVDNVLLNPGATFDRSIFPGASVLGDVNGDGLVTIDDFNVIRDNFRKSPRARVQGDLTGDSLVSLADFKQWKGAFTGSGASLSGMDFSFLSVPEPSSILLTLLVVSGMTGCRCRRRVL